jgi:signal transduction histidine kinase
VGVAFENVTERKRAEQVRGQLASFPELNPNPVIETNSEGVISYLNPAALKRFPDLQLAGAEHATLKGLPQVIAELSSTGKDCVVREVVVGVLIYEQQISFIPQADRVRIYCLDITERKRADAALRASEKALRQLSSRLLQLQDEERRRMARELHDSTGQILTALTMKLGVLRRSVGALDLRASGALSESLALAEQCSRQIRTFSYLLHPPLLDEDGLASALAWYVEGFTGRSGINVELDLAPELGRLSQELETTLFRVVQESLTNIHRHSGSRRATIRVVRDGAEVRLEVKDWGRGMDAHTLDKVSRGVSTLGVGICGMRERVRQLGGELQIDSTGRGTTVSVVLPTLEERHGSGSHGDSGRS